MGDGRHTIRTEKWRYIRYADNTTELYNHDTDSLEWKNLANEEAYVKIKESLSTRLDEMLNK